MRHLNGSRDSTDMGFIKGVLRLFAGFSFRRHSANCREASEIHCTPSTVESSSADPPGAELPNVVPLEVGTTDVPGRLGHIEYLGIPRTIIESGRLNKLTPTALSIYLVIWAEFSRHQTPVTYSIDQLGGMVGRSRRMVSYALEELVAEGLIDRQGGDTEAVRYEPLSDPGIPGALPATHYRTRAAHGTRSVGLIEAAAIDCVVTGNLLHEQFAPIDTLCEPHCASVPESKPVEEPIPAQPETQHGRSNTTMIQQLLKRTVSDNLVTDIETAVGSAQAVNFACRQLLGRGQWFGNEPELRSAIRLQAAKRPG